MPHVAEFASVLGVGEEIYVEINPEVINAEDDVKNYVHVSLTVINNYNIYLLHKNIFLCLQGG